ncbi:hypothetical protein ACMAUO_12680 [Gluconacetobacter sp. Hr-1-5]|uniref:hypothetical protein n=1 Tax=Gluconacetobacter sp. Hr-1-5 TaxID=3395370 RepID=UPI003B5277D7
MKNDMPGIIAVERIEDFTFRVTVNPGQNSGPKVRNITITAELDTSSGPFHMLESERVILCAVEFAAAMRRCEVVDLLNKSKSINRGEP